MNLVPNFLEPWPPDPILPPQRPLRRLRHPNSPTAIAKHDVRIHMRIAPTILNQASVPRPPEALTPSEQEDRLKQGRLTGPVPPNDPVDPLRQFQLGM
jgi:hypothetical protein